MTDLSIWFSKLVDASLSSLQSLWGGFKGFFPDFIGAIVIFIIGLIIATGLQRLIERAVNWAKFDHLLKKTGVEAYFQRANLKLNSGYFLGKVVYWFIFIVFLLAALNVLGLEPLTQFLQSIVAYIPNIIVAALIFVATFLLAAFLKGLIRASIFAAKLHMTKTAAEITWWIVIVFGTYSALRVLLPQEALVVITYLIIGFIAMIALAGGLAFGLGGKDMAARILEKAKEEVSHRM